MAHMYNSEFIHVHCILFYKAEFNFACQQVFRHTYFYRTRTVYTMNPGNYRCLRG